MGSKKEEEFPLMDDEGSLEEDILRYPPKRHGWLAQRQFHLATAFCLIVSVAYNALLSHRLQIERSRPDLCRSNYTGLAYDTPMRYETNWGRNETEADAYWEALDASPVIVAIDYEEAAEKYGLERSAPFPWDDSKGLYYIKAFHHIHCLKVIRKAFKSYEQTGAWDGIVEHLYHCINTIRQDIMCKPDDTLMTSIDKPHVIGDNQIVQCRDWDKLVGWATDPVRHSCYKIFADDRPVAHKLELYAFCPVDSPHYKTMKAYFDIHGHKPVYDDSVKLEGYPGKLTDPMSGDSMGEH